MIEQEFNYGLLFNQVPKILFTSFNQVNSFSDMVVKLARIVREDESITHDQQIFRKIRNESINIDELNEYLDIESLGFKYD